jgi:hypothetical protein
LISLFVLRDKGGKMNLRVSYRNIDNSYYEEQPLSKLPVIGALQRLRNPSAGLRQSNTPGYYYFSSLNKYVYYESFLESTILLHLEYIGTVVELLEQPFILSDETKSHIPDFVVKHSNNSILIVNVKPKNFVEKAENVADFALADLAAKFLGWTHQVFSELNPQYVDNLQWLLGYRNAPYQLEHFETAIKTCLKTPMSLSQLQRQLGSPFLVRPVVFHLLWHRRLFTKLNQRFSDDMTLWNSQGEA